MSKLRSFEYIDGQSNKLIIGHLRELPCMFTKGDKPRSIVDWTIGQLTKIQNEGASVEEDDLDTSGLLSLYKGKTVNLLSILNTLEGVESILLRDGYIKKDDPGNISIAQKGTVIDSEGDLLFSDEIVSITSFARSFINELTEDCSESEEKVEELKELLKEENAEKEKEEKQRKKRSDKFNSDKATGVVDIDLPE